MVGFSVYKLFPGVLKVQYRTEFIVIGNKHDNQNCVQLFREKTLKYYGSDNPGLYTANPLCKVVYYNYEPHNWVVWFIIVHNFTQLYTTNFACTFWVIFIYIKRASFATFMFITLRKIVFDFFFFSFWKLLFCSDFPLSSKIAILMVFFMRQEDIIQRPWVKWYSPHTYSLFSGVYYFGCEVGWGGWTTPIYRVIV